MQFRSLRHSRSQSSELSYLPRTLPASSGFFRLLHSAKRLYRIPKYRFGSRSQKYLPIPRRDLSKRKYLRPDGKTLRMLPIGQRNELKRQILLWEFLGCFGLFPTLPKCFRRGLFRFMKRNTLFNAGSLVVALTFFLFYLSAPLPNDSPGCCDNPTPIIDYAPNQASCDSPDTSSCLDWSVDRTMPANKLCALYAPSSLKVSFCANTRIATCYIGGYSIRKAYFGTGSTPWDLSTATADCTSLGGTIE